MFDFISNPIETALKVAETAVTGDTDRLPSRKEVADLIATGLSVAAAAEALGVAKEVAESVLDGAGGEE